MTALSSARADAHDWNAAPPAHNASQALQASQASQARWSEGYTLVVLAPDADLRRATRLVQAVGGTVALELAPRCLAGWIAPSLDAQLLGRAGIQGLHRDPSTLPPDLASHRATRRIARFFTRAARGELEFAAGGTAGATAAAIAAATAGAAAGGAAGATATSALGAQPGSNDRAQLDFVPGLDFHAGPGVLLPDAIPTPAISEFDIAANLRAQGIAVPRKGSATLAANSEAMTGTIAVGLVFVESNGSGSDPNLHNWTSSREDDVYDEAASALSWWSRRADDHGDCWATFRLEAFFATEDARCGQWREPVLHASTDFSNAISAVLGNMGYTSGNHLARAAAFDATLRTQLATDWAFSAFVAANPSGPTQFTDGYAAWAYLGGPYAALLQHSFAWSFKQVFAHEAAHAFRACDEYSVAGYGGCSSCTGCVDANVPNGNCESCNPDPDSCMMRANTFALCDYTVAQLGWGQRPCMPVALPSPLVVAVTPAMLVPGQESDLDLDGEFFVTGGGLDCGPGISVLSVVALSPSQIRARVRVDVEAAASVRDVAVVNPDGQVGVLPAALSVRATPRHYVAASGGNRFPFERPEDAAVDLVAALAACSSGDTVFVASGTYMPLVLHKTLVLSGSWNVAFASQWPQFPSIIEGLPGVPAVTIDGVGNASVLDGFTIRNGTGAALSPPGLGPTIAGGGVLSLQASPTLRHCILEGNIATSTASTASPHTASTGSGTASTGSAVTAIPSTAHTGHPQLASAGNTAGGGGFFWGGTAVLEHCVVRANTAHRGAGLMFLECDARLDDVDIESNTGDALGTATGAGVAVLAGRLSVHGGRITGNHTVRDGGGVHAVDCLALDLEDVAIENNSASADGGGIFVTGSAATGRGVRIVGNTAGDAGGGLHTMGGALSLDATLVAANHSARGGAGAHIEGAMGSVANVTAADNVGGAGIAWLLAPAPVSVRSSILARNGLGGYMGDGAAPLLDRNLVWQNQGADWIGVTAPVPAFAADPRFTDAPGRDYRLALNSPALDAGDVDPARADVDGSRNDCGAYGGPNAAPPAPARVVTIRARILPGRTRVEWTPSPSPGIANYALYRVPTTDTSVADVTPLALLPATQFEWFDDETTPSVAYAVVAVDEAGHASGARFALAEQQATDSNTPLAVLALHPVSPNPVNPGAWIAFDLPESRRITLVVYAADGRRVRTLAATSLASGSHRVYWDGHTDADTACASGVYFVQLDAGDIRRSRRIVVVR